MLHPPASTVHFAVAEPVAPKVQPLRSSRRNFKNLTMKAGDRKPASCYRRVCDQARCANRETLSAAGLMLKMPDASAALPSRTPIRATSKRLSFQDVSISGGAAFRQIRIVARDVTHPRVLHLPLLHTAAPCRFRNSSRQIAIEMVTSIEGKA
jgi:hypothetical protein